MVYFTCMSEEKKVQDIDLFLQVLNNAEVKIDYELLPLDGLAVSGQPPGVTVLPNVKHAVRIYQRDTDGKRIHRAWFDFNAQGQLEFVTIR